MSMYLQEYLHNAKQQYSLTNNTKTQGTFSGLNEPLAANEKKKLFVNRKEDGRYTGPGGFEGLIGDLSHQNENTFEKLKTANKSASVNDLNKFSVVFYDM